MTQATTSTVQQAYITAKAQYDILCTELSEVMGEAPETDEEIDNYVEQEIIVRKSLGIDEAWKVLSQAEDALIAWGHVVAVKDRRYKAHKAELEQLFSAVSTKIGYRRRVLDLCLRLDASSVK